MGTPRRNYENAHNNACFIVKDATGQALGYFYFEDELKLMLTCISSWTDSVRRLFKILKTRRQIGQPLWRRFDQCCLNRLINAG
jgi:hypothetical protein